VVLVCLDRVSCAFLFEELSAASEVFEKVIAGDVDNSRFCAIVGHRALLLFSWS
jgi:hypothetical protein